MNSATLLERTGLTYRQLDHWTRSGYLHTTSPTPGSGHARDWPDTEAGTATRIRQLIDAGLTLPTAARIARGEPTAINTLAAAIGWDEAK